MTALAVGFLAVVAGVAVAIVVGVRAAARRTGLPVATARRTVAAAAGGLAAWLLFTGALSGAGRLTPTDGRPPVIFLLVWVAIALAVAALRTPAGRATLAAAPGWWLIGLQVFRVPVELLLWRLHAAGLVPERMTFAGRNFDVVVGLSAPLVAWLVATGRLARAGQLAWHAASLALLLNVATTALLSTPGPLRAFHDDVALTVVATLPWVWLPALLVPVAFVSHVMSLALLWRRPALV